MSDEKTKATNLFDFLIAVSNRPLFWLVLLASVAILGGFVTMSDVLDAATRLIHEIKGIT